MKTIRAEFIGKLRKEFIKLFNHENLTTTDYQDFQRASTRAVNAHFRDLLGYNPDSAMPYPLLCPIIMGNGDGDESDRLFRNPVIGYVSPNA